MMRVLAAIATLALCGHAVAAERLYECDDLGRRAELTALNSKLYQGNDGWFFRDSDLNHFYMLSPHTIRFFQRLRDALAYRGVTLTLLPLPPKSVLEPEYAVAATANGEALFDPVFAHAEFAAMVAGLKASGIVTADVLAAIDAASEPLPGDYYFARDIHWRPRLAKISAEAVAAALPADLRGEKAFATTLRGEVPNESNTNTIINQLCSEPVPGEALPLYVTELTDQSFDSFLADEEPPPVSIVGTSFTDEAKGFNFSGFLREAMQNEVATYSISGGGVDTALFKWAYDGLAATSGTKALVWELPFPDRIETIAPSMERTIVPAIAGNCAGTAQEVATKPYTLDADGRFVLPLDGLAGVSGDGVYVAATLSNPALPVLTMIFDYADGGRDVLPIVRPDRVPSMPTIYGQLASDISTDLASVTFVAPGQPLSGTVSICRYPTDMLQPDL